MFCMLFFKVLANQPIPKWGRKFALFRHSCTLYIEPTHPQSGTKIKFSVGVRHSTAEPTHPQAGTKTLVCFFTERIIGEPPIPKRGRKFRFCGDWIFTLHEPTHPQAGTKISDIIFLHPFFSTNHPIPTRGRKCYRMILMIYNHVQNQSIPKRGRKSVRW